MKCYKKVLLVFLSGIILAACTDIETESNKMGSIYGVATAEESAEVLRGIGIELHEGPYLPPNHYDVPRNYRTKGIILKTVTYDDGHYEFVDLEPGQYLLRTVSEDYETNNYLVMVEGGRQARQDMQLKQIDKGITVLTYAPSVTNSKVTFKGRFWYTDGYPSEVGFIYGENSNPTFNNGKTVKAAINYYYEKYEYYYMFEVESDLAVTQNHSKKGHVRAYAKNSKGISYGEDREFMY